MFYEGQLSNRDLKTSWWNNGANINLYGASRNIFIFLYILYHTQNRVPSDITRKRKKENQLKPSAKNLQVCELLCNINTARWLYNTCYII